MMRRDKLARWTGKMLGPVGARSQIDNLPKTEHATERVVDACPGTIFKIDDRLILKNPSPQTALDIFKGAWISRLPGQYAQYAAGSTPLFDDTRIPLATNFFGAIKGQHVLDLGPLEGGQAYVLEQMGARSVVSVEANSILYLKCLVVKELLGMQRVKFLCGDVIEYLKNTAEHFDICIASGILYHMVDPIELLRLVSEKADKVMIWTHYYDENNAARNKIGSFNGTATKDFRGTSYTYHRQEYGIGFEAKIYCGGTARHSSWMSKEGILSALKACGYLSIDLIDDGDSVNGPFLLIAALK